MATVARVLVVDDEPIVREVLTRYLARDGFEVAAVGDGEAALAAYDRRPPDLVVLDLMLPRIGGLEVFRRIQEGGPTPVIMLTARGEETDRVVGLDMGADDYIAKPFSPSEVVSRARAVLRRAGRHGLTLDEAMTLSFGDLEIDPGPREARVGGRRVPLSPAEFELLHFLASSPRMVFTRGELLERVWDVATDADPSTVTVQIRRLREKIEHDPSNPRRLVTVWGAGYRFEP